MEFSRQVLLVCTLWCYLDQVHLSPSSINQGLLPFESLATSVLEENFRECGKSKKTSTYKEKLSIVGGRNATLGNWPWMAALLAGSPLHQRPFVWCGGTLISRQWVITAAHCIKKEADLFVRLGVLKLHNETTDGAKPIDAFIDRTELHPNFPRINTSLINDIALIRLQKPVNFTDNIRPICLLSGPQYEADQYYDGKEAFVAGWGRVIEDGDFPEILQEATVKVVPKKVCAKQYANDADLLIDEKVICAAEKGKDTCEFDSGGPLMFLNATNGRYYLGGITSGGRGCARNDFSGVYTKVAQFISFIKEKTGENF